MVESSHKISFMRLGHHVANVNFGRRGNRERLSKVFDQKVGQDTRIEAPGSDHDAVRVRDGLQSVFGGGASLRLKIELLDGTGGFADVALTFGSRAIGMLSDQGYFFEGGRYHAAANREDLARFLDGLFKIAGDFKHRQNKKVAEVVSFELAGFLKTKLKKLAHHRLRIGQGNEAISDIAGRRHIELAPQTPRRASVVGDGDDRGNVGSKFFEAMQQNGEPRASPDHDDPRTALKVPFLVHDIHELVLPLGKQHGHDGFDDLPDADRHEDHPQKDEEAPAGLLVVDDRQDKAHGAQDDPETAQEHPAFLTHAWIKPLE